MEAAREINLSLSESVDVNEELKVGARVIFKRGHPDEGLVGIIMNKESDGYMIKVGSLTRTGVKDSDLNVMPSDNNYK